MPGGPQWGETPLPISCFATYPLDQRCGGCDVHVDNETERSSYNLENDDDGVVVIWISISCCGLVITRSIKVPRHAYPLLSISTKTTMAHIMGGR